MKKVNFAAVGRDLYLDLPLSQTIMDYRQDGLIADLIAPVVNVNKQSGAIIEFSQGDRWRIVDDKRAPGTEAKRFSIDVSSQLYNCNNYALQAGVTIEDRANADPVFASRIIEGRAMSLTDKLQLNWENRVSLQVTSTSNVGSSAAVSSVWSTPEGDGNPLLDINTAIDNIRYATGYRPNTLVFGAKPWDGFRRHKNVRNLIFGVNNGGGYANTAQAKEVFEMETVLVAGAFKNSAEENIANSIGNIWGTSVLLAYIPRTPAIDRPSFMYSYRLAAPGIPNMQVERHPYNSKTKTDDIEVGYYQDEKITGARFGFLLTGTVA
jgi:hypothetical protein